MANRLNQIKSLFCLSTTSCPHLPLQFTFSPSTKNKSVATTQTDCVCASTTIKNASFPSKKYWFKFRLILNHNKISRLLCLLFNFVLYLFSHNFFAICPYNFSQKRNVKPFKWTKWRLCKFNPEKQFPLHSLKQWKLSCNPSITTSFIAVKVCFPIKEDYLHSLEEVFLIIPFVVIALSNKKYV